MMERRLDKPRTGHLPNGKLKILTNLPFAFPVRDHRASSFRLAVNITASHPLRTPEPTKLQPQISIKQLQPGWLLSTHAICLVAPMSDQGTRALVVAKEGTGANTARASGTKTKVERMKIDNEFSDLSKDYTIQKFLFQKVNNYLSVKRRFKKNLIFRQKTLSANAAILEIIDKGCKIPFFKTTRCASFCNNQSALKSKDFVEKSISELLKCGSIIEGDKLPEVINSLSFSLNSLGKKRLILDLRYVNTHVYKDKIKFEDWKCFEHYLEGKERYLLKFDLRNGYHHIDIFEPRQKFFFFPEYLKVI